MSRGKALVVGGSSGLGLEIAKLLKKEFRVTITGRSRGSSHEGFAFQVLNITSDAHDCEKELGRIAQKQWDIIVYAAGFYQEGHIDELTDEGVQLMNNVCLTIPEMLMSRILKTHANLGQLVIITSTSAVIPREREPAYSAAKAGLHMLAYCLQEDERIGSVLLVAPCGMNTNFYSGTFRDVGEFTDPAKIAERITVFLKERVQFIELGFKRTDSEPFFELWQERRIHTNPEPLIDHL